MSVNSGPKLADLLVSTIVGTMNLLNQIFPGAVTAKNGVTKAANANSGSEGETGMTFALELPDAGAAVSLDPDAILNPGQDTANAPVESPVTTEIATSPADDFFMDSGAPVNAESAPSAPIADVATEPSAENAHGAPLKADLSGGSEEAEQPAAPIGAAGKNKSNEGLLAGRAGSQAHAAGTAQGAEAAASVTGAGQTPAADTDESAAPAADRNMAAKPLPEQAARPGNAPEFAVAADITPKAREVKKSGKEELSAKTGQVSEASTASSKAPVSNAASPSSPAEGAPARAALLKSASINASHDFTFQLAANDEVQAQGNGGSENGLNISAAKPGQMANGVTAAAGARTPSLPIQAIAVEISQRFQAGENKFRIKLDPPELGRIDVRLSVSRDGHITSQMTVDKPETLAALSRDAGALERALNSSGLETDKSSLNFSLRQGNQGFGNSNGEGEPGSSAQAETGASHEETEDVPERVIRGYANASGVDLHV